MDGRKTENEREGEDEEEHAMFDDTLEDVREDSTLNSSSESSSNNSSEVPNPPEVGEKIYVTGERETEADVWPPTAAGAGAEDDK